MNIQFYASFSLPHSMLLLTYPLNLKFYVFLSRLFILCNVFISTHLKCSSAGIFQIYQIKIPCSLFFHLSDWSQGHHCVLLLLFSFESLIYCQIFLRNLPFSQCWQQSHHYNQVTCSFDFLFICSCLFSDLCTPWEMFVCFPVVLLWTLQQNNPLSLIFVPQGTF